jgi:hypothetical protein
VNGTKVLNKAADAAGLCRSRDLEICGETGVSVEMSGDAGSISYPRAIAGLGAGSVGG